VRTTRQRTLIIRGLVFGGHVSIVAIIRWTKLGLFTIVLLLALFAVGQSREVAHMEQEVATAAFCQVAIGAGRHS
jgi:hypothetical protein